MVTLATPTVAGGNNGRVAGRVQSSRMRLASSQSSVDSDTTALSKVHAAHSRCERRYQSLQPVMTGELPVVSGLQW